MICFVDIEHENAFQERERRRNHYADVAEIKLRLEGITREACLVQHYSRVTWERLCEWGIKALVVSGNVTDWKDYGAGDWDELHQIFRDAELPIIGFCGGCQLIAMAHGAPLGPIRLLRDGEQDPLDYQPGYFKEWGYMPVRVVQPDPLFKGLGDEPVLFEAHYWEIKEPPPGFTLIASTDDCRVQAIKRDDKLVYATQFHPEIHDDEHSDGRKLLANFFELAGVIK